MIRNRSPSSRGAVNNDTALARGRPERFGPAFWVSADVGTTIATGVSQWNDRSGNGRNVTQGTAANQPALVASAYAGKPCVRFDGTNDDLQRASTNLFGSGAYTICAALNVISIVANGTFLGNGTAAAGVFCFTGAGNTRSLLHQGVESHTDGALQTTSLELWTAIRPAASAPTLQVNGASVSVTNTNPAVTDPGGTAVISLGSLAGVNFSNEDLTETVYFARDITTSEAMRLNHYMGARWGLAA